MALYNMYMRPRRPGQVKDEAKQKTIRLDGIIIIKVYYI
jgi:hypothetical protein